MPVSLQQILLSILGLIILISQISVYFDRKLLINLNVNLASFNQQKTEPNNAATTPVLSKPYTKNTKPLILFYEIEYLGDTRPGGTGKLDQFCKNECDYQHVAKPSDQEIENMNGQISVLDPTKYWNFKKANLIVFSAEAPRRSPPFVFFRDQLDAQAKLFPGKNAGEKFANYRDLENVPWVLWESRTPNEEYIYDYNRKNNIYNYTFGYSKTFDIRNLAGSPFERAGTIYGLKSLLRKDFIENPDSDISNKAKNEKHNLIDNNSIDDPIRIFKFWHQIEPNIFQNKQESPEYTIIAPVACTTSTQVQILQKVLETNQYHKILPDNFLTISSSKLCQNIRNDDKDNSLIYCKWSKMVK